MCLMQMWDIRSNQLLQHYAAHSGPVTNVAFHPSGDFLLSSSLDTTVKVGLLLLCQVPTDRHAKFVSALANSVALAIVVMLKWMEAGDADAARTCCLLTQSACL